MIIFDDQEFDQMYLLLYSNAQIDQAPHERMAYRCSFCGIIFDSISHRERHEQRHKVLIFTISSIGVYKQPFRTMTHLSVKTATRCSKMRRTWGITTKPITSFPIQKRQLAQQQENQSPQIRYVSFSIYNLSGSFTSLIFMFHKMYEKGKIQFRIDNKNCVTWMKYLVSSHLIGLLVKICFIHEANMLNLFVKVELKQI